MPVNAVVDDLFVGPCNIVVYHRGVVIDDIHLLARHGMGSDVPVCKVGGRHKCKMRRTQPKRKIVAHGSSAPCPTNAHTEPRAGGQRRPTAIVAGCSPRNPGRSPFTFRQPDPAALRMIEPASVMEGGPAPGIMRMPIPTRIRPHPITIVAIGLPSRVDHHDRWLPAPAIGLDFNP